MAERVAPIEERKREKESGGILLPSKMSAGVPGGLPWAISKGPEFEPWMVLIHHCISIPPPYYLCRGTSLPGGPDPPWEKGSRKGEGVPSQARRRLPLRGDKKSPLLLGSVFHFSFVL